MKINSWASSQNTEDLTSLRMSTKWDSESSLKISKRLKTWTQILMMQLYTALITSLTGLTKNLWNSIPFFPDKRVAVAEGNVKSLRGEVDWTSKLGPIKDQASCGSCWAFAANGVHEASYNILKGEIVDLSEQELVDCSRSFNNQGCRGGWYDWAWNYVLARKGIHETNAYPYVGRDQICKTPTAERGHPIDKWEDIFGQDNIKTEIARAPVAVAVDASNWSSYTTGIFNNCGE
jgi:C1A family cysteine protease